MAWSGLLHCAAALSAHDSCPAAMRASQHQGLRAFLAHLVMKSLHSAEMAGFAGKTTWRAFSMTSSRRISSWLQPSPNGLRPNSIWYSITPTAHTSTCSGRIGDKRPEKLLLRIFWCLPACCCKAAYLQSFGCTL